MEIKMEKRVERIIVDLIQGLQAIIVLEKEDEIVTGSVCLPVDDQSDAEYAPLHAELQFSVEICGESLSPTWGHLSQWDSVVGVARVSEKGFRKEAEAEEYCRSQVGKIVEALEKRST